jgi:hypothetical protein
MSNDIPKAKQATGPKSFSNNATNISNNTKNIPKVTMPPKIIRPVKIITLDEVNDAIYVCNDNLLPMVWIHADPKNGGSGIDLNNQKGNTTIKLDGDQGNATLSGSLNVAQKATFYCVQTGSLNEGTAMMDKNGISLAQSKTHYFTISLNGENSTLNLANPDDGHSTIMLDAANNKLSVGSVLIDGQAGNATLSGSLNAQNASLSGLLNVGNGSIKLDGASGDIWIANADCAEEFDTAVDNIQPGTVVILDDDGRIAPSSMPYSTKVIGVVSGAGENKPGLILDKRKNSSSRVPVALVGKVYCRVDASHAPIRAGDLLTTAASEGHAMRVTNLRRAFGAVLGKALAPLKSGSGLIPVLVTLQ